MRIGIQASYSGGFQETAAEIRDLESAGLDVAMVAEVYTFDAVSQLGYLAAVTERVELLSGIFPIYSRTPALTAMTAAGLDFVSGGRFTLGLGASGPQVIEGWHGVPYDAPLQRTREIVEICRQVWRRERLVHEGKKYTIPLPADQGTGLGKPLKLINTPVRDRIPIMLAALGPKNVELAAEIAEAWEPIFFIPGEGRRGLGRRRWPPARPSADPALGELQVITGVPVAIGDDVEPPAGRRARRRWRCTSAAWAPGARTSTTTSPAATATRPRPRRSRTSTWTARRTRPPPRCPTSWCGPPR